MTALVRGDYDPRAFPAFAVAADIVVLGVHERLSVLLVRRGVKPFAGRPALPGGFVREAESADAAARRELLEETGLAPTDLGDIHLEQLATFSAPDRDPRMRVVSVAHLALSPARPEPTAGTDAAAARWVAVDDVLGDVSHDAPRDGTDGAFAGPLAFDHADILATGVERARSKLEYTTLATSLAGPEFTLGELQRVYETTWGTRLERANFRRKVLGTPGFVEATGKRHVGEAGGAPASVYRAGGEALLVPPMMRGPRLATDPSTTARAGTSPASRHRR